MCKKWQIFTSNVQKFDFTSRKIWETENLEISTQWQDTSMVGTFKTWVTKNWTFVFSDRAKKILHFYTLHFDPPRVCGLIEGLFHHVAYRFPLGKYFGEVFGT